MSRERMPDLTPDQQNQLNTFLEYFGENRCWPTIRECVVAWSLTSTSLVHPRIQKLIDMGLLMDNQLGSRTTSITDAGVKEISVFNTLGDYLNSLVIEELASEE